MPIINVNQANASETTKGIVEEATQAELNAGTDTGATGAKLFAVPSKILSLLGSYLTTASASTTYQTIAGLFASVMALVLTGFSAGANTAVSATDTIAQALAKFQGQINARPNENATTIATITNSTASKTTPVDADEVVGMDSANSFVLIKYSWTNIKAFLKTYFDTVYQAVLVSGTNIKTVNSSSLLGAGDLVISGGGLTVVTKNINYQPTAGELVVYDTNAANRTVTTPAAPSADQRFGVYLKTKTLAFSVIITGLDTLYTQGDYVEYQYDGSNWLKVIDRIRALEAKISRTTAQAITLNTETTVLCGTVDFDPSGITVIASSNITVPKTAFYYVSAFTSIVSVADGITLFVRVNKTASAVILTSGTVTGGAATTFRVGKTDLISLTAGDDITLIIRCGASANTDIGSSSCFLHLREAK